jgi:hypothetical protein
MRIMKSKVDFEIVSVVLIFCLLAAVVILACVI